MGRKLFLVTALALAAFGFARPAAAAPQILGLVAYNEAVPLNCGWGQCSAELITLCLQKHRDNPLPNTAYRLYGEGQAQLIVTDAAGEQRRLPAADHVRITTARSFTAVRVEITERKLRKLGGVKVAMTVPAGMSLVPVEKPGDPNPITQQEIDYTTAYLRVEADRWLKGSAPKTVAARIVNRMINFTPRAGRIASADWQTLWDKSVRNEGGEDRAAGRTRANDIYGACRYMVGDLGRYFSMRRCLESKHDSLMLDMNTDYWDATKPGS